MLTQASVDAFLLHLERMGRSDLTVRAYRTDLTNALEAIPPLDNEDWTTVENAIAAYINQQRNTLAPKSLRRRLSALRGWAKHAGHPGTLLDGYKLPVPSAPQPHPIPEGIDGVVSMIRSSRNPRHRALCALTGLVGLRVDEAIRVTRSDFDLSARTLTVRGKGDKTRVVPFGETAWKFICKAYEVATENDGEVLVPLRNRGARAAISRHARNAGLSRHVSSHDMRATFATAAYGHTHDLRAVQELLGHADPATTQVYTGVTMSSMRAAAEVA